MNQMTFIRTLIYALKRDYGDKIQLYTQNSQVIDTATGVRTSVISVININRAIVTTGMNQRIETYNRAYIQANKSFTYGGDYDTTKRFVIIDKRDLPKDFEITVENWLVYKNKRYEIKSVNIPEHNLAIELIVTALKGQPPNVIHSRVASSRLFISQEAINEQ